MFSVGTDIINIKRVENAMKKTDSFLNRFFGEDERAELLKKNNAPQSVAAAFAAKEAFSKSIGTGVRGFALNEVQILHDELGAPYFSFSGKAAEIVRRGGYSFSVSLSHSEEFAIAVVAAFKQ